MQFRLRNIGGCLLEDRSKRPFGDLFAFGDHERFFTRSSFSTEFDMAAFLAMDDKTERRQNCHHLFTR